MHRSSSRWVSTVLGVSTGLTSIVFIVSAVALALRPGTSAHAWHNDYTVPSLPNWNAVIGGPGAKVWDANTSPALFVSDAVTQWNNWTNNGKLSTIGSASNCGNGSRCVIYTNDDPDAITVNGKVCQSDPLPSTTWGRTYFGSNAEGLMWWMPGCVLFGPDSYPVWIVSYNNDGPAGAQTMAARIHIPRHELAHALHLGHHSAPCWFEFGNWYPLMNNGTGVCAGFPNNYRATPNEIAKAKSANGW